jgi:hypothetical protein
MAEESATPTPRATRDEILNALVGEWEGTYRLWLQPGEPRTEGPTRCTGRPVLDGRFVALDYAWTDLDGPQIGSMLLGCTDEGQWELAWVDSWHTGRSMLFSVGGPEADVLGSYAGEWGWRTRFDVAPAGGWVVNAWNITPAGEETKATEATYRRCSD